VLLVPVACGWDWILRFNSEVSAAEYRTAGLIVAIALMANELAKAVTPSRKLNDLVELRRDLVLGRIAIDAAANRLDILASGLRLADVINDQFRGMRVRAQALKREIA